LEGEGTPETPMEAQLGRVSPTLQILRLEEFLTLSSIVKNKQWVWLSIKYEFLKKSFNYEFKIVS
jgi:hypothetical protein